MRLQELKKKEMSEVEEARGRTTLVLLQSSLYSLKGDWLWNMNTNEVFCSDVMLSLPGDFAGTRAIFYPDDVEAVRVKLATAGNQIENISFRIITTYGEVKMLEGQNILLEKEADGFEQWQQKK